MAYLPSMAYDGTIRTVVDPGNGGGSRTARLKQQQLKPPNQSAEGGVDLALSQQLPERMLQEGIPSALRPQRGVGRAGESPEENRLD